MTRDDRTHRLRTTSLADSSLRTNQVVSGFSLHVSDEIGPVSNELGINAPRTEKSGFDLFGTVVARAERLRRPKLQ